MDFKMEETVYSFLKNNEQNGYFTFALATKSMIDEAQVALNLSIPNQYISFLATFGQGGIGNVDIFGIGKNHVSVFVNETLKYREYGLPLDLIVVENCDEWLHCLDSNTGNVVMWTRSSDGYSVLFDDFNSFLIDRVEDALENI